MKKNLTLLPLIFSFQLYASDEAIKENLNKIKHLLDKNEVAININYGISFSKNNAGKIVAHGISHDNNPNKLFNDILTFFNQPVTLANEEGKWGITDGTNVVNSKYDYPINFIIRVPFSFKKKTTDMGKVSNNNKYGYIDKNGKEVIPIQFESSADFIDGVAAVKKEKWGFIDKKGQVIIDFQYDDVNDFSEGLAYVVQGDKKGFIDKQGKWVLSIDYDGATKFQDGLATVKQDKKQGVINKQGKMVIKPKYRMIYPFENGLAVTSDEKIGFIDKTGKKVIPFIYNRALSFYGDVAAVEKDGKWGFINKKGETVLPFEYDSVRIETNNIYLVNKGIQSGYVNTDGKIIIDFKYAMGKPFQSGFAKVEAKDFSKSYILDTKGNIVREFSKTTKTVLDIDN